MTRPSSTSSSTGQIIELRPGASASTPSNPAPASNPAADPVAFLTRLLGNGPHDLVAIWPDGRVEGERFEDRQAARNWIADRDGGAGIFYHLNELREAPPSGRAKREDVVKFRFAAADIDPPPACVNFAMWRGRVVDDLLAAQSPPDVIIRSGYGLHALWRIEPPMPINSPDDVERAEALNRALRNEFGGDRGVWTVDRIFRIPGTWNLPNQKKAEAGRVPVRAEVIRDAL